MGYSTYNFDLGVADGNPQLAPLADAAILYPKVEQIGLKYWRIMCPWNFVAKTQAPGTTIAGTPPTTTGRDWTYIDRCINDILLSSGCDILMIIGQGRPSWGGFQFLWFSFGATVGNATDYGNFVTEVVTRYKPGGVGIRTDGIYAPNAGKGVTHWEIWNEQNSQLWCANVNPTDYTAYLKAAYTAIKAIQPGTASTVIFGGLQHVQREPAGYFGYGSTNLDEVTFLSRCYDAGAHGFFDAVAEHIYTQTDTQSPPVAVGGTVPGPAPATTTDNWQQLLAIRALMVAKGDSAKPIWITEVGFATNSLTEAQQLAYMQQVFTNLSALGYVAVVIMFNARDNAPCNNSAGVPMHDDSTAADWNNAFGLMYYDFTPKALMAWLLSLVPHNFALSVTPALHAAAALGPVHGTFSLSVTPSLAMSAAERYRAAFALSVTPSFAMSAAERYRAAFGLAVTPSINATGAIAGSGGFALTLAPSLAFSGAERYGRTFALSVTPALAMAAAERYSAAFGLAVTPSIAVAGKDRQVGAFGLSVTPSIGFAGVGSRNPVAFDAVGPGSNALVGFNPSVSCTWTHTASGTNRAVLVAIAGINNSLAATGQTRTVTYGGTSMTSLGIEPDSSGGAAYVELFYLLSPPTGAQTVVATVSGGGNTGRAMIADSVSYTNVASIVSAGSVAGSATPATETVTTSAALEMIVHAFEAQSAISSYSQTQRVNAQVVGHATTFLIGDAPGASSVAFTATVGGFWASTAARLIPV